jgi:HAMP domain-containing protein
MCPSTIYGWFEIAALFGSAFLFFSSFGVKRRYGLAILVLLGLIHFYAVLSWQQVLGWMHTVSTPYLTWALFPIAAPAAISVGGLVGPWLVGRRAASSPWMPAVASCLIAAFALFAWFQLISPNQPRVPGGGLLDLPQIAHTPTKDGPVVDYLQRHIGLKPGAEFQGYASTFLGARDGLVLRNAGVPNGIMTYILGRDVLSDKFGNSFQMMDLWNRSIPTLEEYGQWVSKQMYYFDRDLLARPQDELNSAFIYLYQFRPLLLRALGVRFIIADGTLADPSIEHVMTESGKAGAQINLYEIKNANLGQFSPTKVRWVADYPAAVRALREQDNLENWVVLLGVPERHMDLVSASSSRIVAIKDGYLLRASAPGRAMLVLPVQFSHCWRIDNAADTEPPVLFRANIIQTGVLFKDSVDVSIRFDFEPWRASCRLQDARDLTSFAFN